MRRFIFSLLLAISMFAPAAHAQQSPWQRVSPLPTIYPLTALSVISPDTLALVGSYGTIIRSSSGGRSWNTQEVVLGDTDNFNDVQFLTSSTGWAVGDNGTVMKTTDGGTRWSLVDFPSIGTILSVNFLNSTLGWVSGTAGMIYKTTNGGATWINQYVPLRGDLYSIKFVNSSVGFAAGTRGRIWRTTNGGSNWNVFQYDSTKSFFSIYFPSATNGYAVGQAGIFHTTDGGVSWSSQKLPLNVQKAYTSIYFINDQIGWAAGFAGTVLKTTDGGTTWLNKTDDLSDDLWAIRFANASVGWAVGDNGRILYSSDGGETWALQSTGTMFDFESMTFASPTVAYGVSLDGLIQKTTDRGESWKTQLLNPDREFLAVSFADPNYGVVASDSGIIYRTQNGGSSWLRRTNITEEIINGVYARSEDTAWAVGDNSVTLQSSVLGYSSWTENTPGLPISLSNVKFQASGVGFALGFDGSILKSTDRGVTWVPKISGVSQPLYSIDFPSEGVVVVGGDLGTIIKSTDAGETWMDYTQDVTTSFYALAFYSPLVGWAAGDDGMIMRTTDGGETWEEQYLPTTATFQTLNIFRVGNGALIIAGGTGSTVYCATYAALSAKRWNGGTSADWTNAANWTPAGQPTSIDSVIIPTGVTTPFIAGPVQQIDLGYLEVQSGGTLRIGSSVGTIVARNGFKVSGSVQIDAGGSPTIISGGDLTIADNARILGGSPQYVASGTGHIQGSFSSLRIEGSANMTSSGGVSVKNMLLLLSDLTMRAGDTLFIRNGAPEAFAGYGKVQAGVVKRAIASGSTGLYRFESPATTIQFLGTGGYPDSIAVVATPGVTPPGFADSLFVHRGFSILTWGANTAPVNLTLGFEDSESALNIANLGLYRDSSNVLINVGSSTWVDDVALGVELDSTMLFDTWYIGNYYYYPPTPFDFNNVLIVSNNGGSADTLGWGASPDGSYGLDPVLGESSLPPPTPGMFDARWRLTPTITTKLNIRHPLIDSSLNVYRCEFQQGGGGLPITFKWNKDSLPAGDVFLRDAATGGTKFSVNMKLMSSFAMTDGSVTAVEIVHKRPRYYAMRAGWNLVGYPVRVTTSASPTYNFRLATSNLYAWGSGYVRVDSMVPGPGYWIKYRKRSSAGIEGNPLLSATANIKPGWNMVGSLWPNIPLTAVSQNPPGVLASPLKLYGYDGGYSVTDSVYSGKGYWVKGVGTGTITFTGGAAAPKETESPIAAVSDLAAFNAITIADARGGAQTLYFGTADASRLGDMEMPPLSPDPAFDARFASQRMLEQIDPRLGTTSLPVVVSNAQYPLTVTGSFVKPGQSLTLIDPGTGKTLGTLGGAHGDVVALGAPPSGRILLQINSSVAQVPREFALEQNYPNPFNPVTMLRFDLAQPGTVTLKVFNILGQEVASLLDRQDMAAGIHETRFDGSSLGSGVYFCRIIVNAADSHRLLFTETRKLLLVK